MNKHIFGVGHWIHRPMGKNWSWSFTKNTCGLLTHCREVCFATSLSGGFTKNYQKDTCIVLQVPFCEEKKCLTCQSCIFPKWLLTKSIHYYSMTVWTQFFPFLTVWTPPTSTVCDIILYPPSFFLKIRVIIKISKNPWYPINWD